MRPPLTFWRRNGPEARARVVLWGGGSPKNFMLQTEPQIQEVLRIKEFGQDYFLQVTDARPDTGGLSGATPSEAVSWGKVDPDRLPDAVVCYTDTTIAMPILTHYALARHPRRKLRRLYDQRGKMMKALTKEYFKHNKVKMIDGTDPSVRAGKGWPSPSGWTLPIAGRREDAYGYNPPASSHRRAARHARGGDRSRDHPPQLRQIQEAPSRVQAYYAVKANPAPEIVRTLYDAGASFDVASLPEFMLVYENIKHLPPKEQQDFIWDKIIFANPTKPKETLQALDRYKPLVTYDNRNELLKIKQYAPHAGVVLRLRVPNTGSMVELSSKFGCDPGEAVDLICAAFDIGLVVEGLSFHVGSQCANFENFVQALNIAAAVLREANTRGHEIKILDIGGGFPVAYDRHVKPFSPLARMINAEIDRLFPRDMQILAEPGRFFVATAATLVARIIGKAVRDGKPCYFIDDSVYHTFSGIIFDHCQYHLKAFKKGATEVCAVYGQTCDGMDTISQSEQLPDLQIDDLVYSENIGAYSNASSTWFNGFPPATVVHINQ